MDVVDAVLPAVAVVVPTVLVLRDVRAFDRPARPEPPVPEPAEPAVEAAPGVEVEPPAEEPPLEPLADDDLSGDADVDTGSMLSGLTATETDERSWLRRVGALVVLLVLTLVTAALVGAGIYNAVSGLG